MNDLAKQAALYGALLAVGTLALQWVDYLTLARAHTAQLMVFLVAAAFLGLGIFIGARVISKPSERPLFDGNPKARDTLGISAREYEVLHELASGRTNKEIAARLKVSPNTIKTHIARLYEKLGAKRRTDAVNRARDLGFVP